VGFDVADFRERRLPFDGFAFQHAVGRFVGEFWIRNARRADCQEQ
jgi:hypothetical protein